MVRSIRWKRVLPAAVLSEVVIIAILLAAITIYRRFIHPGLSEAELATLGQRAGYYVAPAAGAIVTFFTSLWAARPLATAQPLNGAMVGIVSSLLSSPFMISAPPSDQFMYVIAFVLRVATGYLGGVTAGKRSLTTANAL